MRIVENKVYSQNGEDGVIESIFVEIGIEDKFFVEIGCEEGKESNTHKLSDLDNWIGIRIDTNYSDANQRGITQENVCDTLRAFGVPKKFDVLSIDIDFNDFHVLRAVLAEFSPRVVVAEYNSSLGPSADLVVPYLRDHRWDRTNFFGASYAAFKNLGKMYGYEVIYCESQGVNLFMIRVHSLGSHAITDSDAFRPPRYGAGSGHPIDHLNRKYLCSEHYLLPGVATAITRFGIISYFQNDVYIGGAFAQGAYWDEHLIEHVSNRLADLEGMVLDIGAHVGSHSVALAHLNPCLRFMCFEPQRPLFLLLERNIHENGLSGRFEAVNAAVGHAKMTSSLSSKIIVEEANFEKPVEYGSSSPINLGGMQLGSGGVRCEMLRIDDLALPPVRYLKVDVEGAEPLVFYGMRQLLARDFPLVSFEDRDDRRLSPETWAVLGAAAEIRDFSSRRQLLALGYDIEKIGLDYLARPPSTLNKLPLRTRAVANDTIPKCIFQTWKSKTEFPSNFAYWLSTFDAHNPLYQHIIWDDHDNYHFIASYFEWFLPTYRNYPREIYRADAIRYFFLYSFGGIYADMDVECLQPLDRLLVRGDVVLGRMGSNPNHPHCIPNAVMASKPKQEFWLLVIWLLMDAARHEREPEFSTGPVVLKSAVDLYLAKDPQWVSSVIQAIAYRLPQDLQPEPKFSNIEILPSYEWFAIDWTDPIHQRLRSNVLGTSLLSDQDKKELFYNSSLVTYWAHSY